MWALVLCGSALLSVLDLVSRPMANLGAEAGRSAVTLLNAAPPAELHFGQLADLLSPAAEDAQRPPSMLACNLLNEYSGPLIGRLNC